MALDFKAFERLAGAATTNWEALSREAVRRVHASCGEFRAYNQQPGVEFHLRVTRASTALGEAGRWWGWQCRWWDLPAGRKIGKTRRDKVEKAIKTTRRDLPDLTDWVLWTRNPLTPTDQTWFYGLKGELKLPEAFELRLWTAADTDGLLSGEAAPLRRTYFGDLAFTPDELAQMHEDAVAPVQERWDPQLNVEVDAIAALRQSLGDPRSSIDFRDAEQEFDESFKTLDAAIRTSGEGEARDRARAIARRIRPLRSFLKAAARELTDGDVVKARTLLVDGLERAPSAHISRRDAARLRALADPLAFPAQQCWSLFRRAMKLARSTARALDVSFVSVLGGAGEGKSFLSAELTAPADQRPAGFFIQGRPLARGNSLDSLVKRLQVGGIRRWNELLDAAESAGARSGRRIPIAIDGLNESESPHQWLDLLKVAISQVERLAHVLLIVTVRHSAAEAAVPPNQHSLELDGFGVNAGQALRVYFDHYKLELDNVLVPQWLFTTPLLLRLFCEASNPERKQPVKVEDVPLSLPAIFDAYRLAAVQRAAKDSEVESWRELDDRLTAAGRRMWQSGRRALPTEELTEIIGEHTDWSRSPVRALEEQGVLQRDLGEGTDQVSGLLFDQFAGYIVADAIIDELPREELHSWFEDDGVREKLGLTEDAVSRFAAAFTRLSGFIQRVRRRADLPAAHPLAEDTLEALAGLLPRRLTRQLWPYLDGEPRERALLHAAELEAGEIDTDTRQALIERITPGGGKTRQILARCQEVCDIPGHPLNADLLADALGNLAVWQRDLLWTEWLRSQASWTASRFDDPRTQASRWSQRWRWTTDRSERDRLRAEWLAWSLTTTRGELRALASNGLYLWGLRAPAAHFELTLRHCGNPDPYIWTRLMQISYGICLAGRVSQEDLGPYLAHCWALFGPDGETPTWNRVARDALESLLLWTSRYRKDALPTDWTDTKELATGTELETLKEESPHSEEIRYAIGMDFENYTVGGEIEDRSNYDYDHEDFKKAMSIIRGRMWQLGWRKDRFQEIDDRIRDAEWRPGRTDETKTERYGKKYSRIAFEEWATWADRHGLRRDRPGRGRSGGLDPTFPRPLWQPDHDHPDWVRATPKSNLRWLRHGLVRVPDSYVAPEAIGPHRGPWFLMAGYLRHGGYRDPRSVWGRFSSFALAKRDVRRMRAAFERDILSRYALEHLDRWQTYAGELSWRERSGLEYDDYELTALEVDGKQALSVTNLVEWYAWEADEKAWDPPGGPVLTAEFARQAELTTAPGSLSMVDPVGNAAALTIAPTEPKQGSLLFVRADLLRAYLGKREIVLLARGERQLGLEEIKSDGPALRQALAKAIWSETRVFSELCE